VAAPEQVRLTSLLSGCAGELSSAGARRSVHVVAPSERSYDRPGASTSGGSGTHAGDGPRAHSAADAGAAACLREGIAIGPRALAMQ